MARCTDQNNAACRDRVQLVSPGRDGSSAIRIATLDLDQYDGATWERTQLNLNPADTAISEGAVQWWANSMFFPTNSEFGAAMVMTTVWASGASTDFTPSMK